MAMGTAFSRLFSQRNSPSLELDSFPENVLVEIFIRLPPHPAFLRVISLTCTRFRKIVTSPDFLRLFRAHHGDVPPLVGFIRNQSPRFLPMPGGGVIHYESNRVVAGARALEPHDVDWIVLSCHHGKVLLQSTDLLRLLIVDPIAGHRQYVDAPSWYRPRYDSNAVMVCAAGHCDCRSRSFRIVFIYFSRAFFTEMSIYSSETKQWSQIESNKKSGPLPSPIDLSRPILRMDNVLYCLTIFGSILCFSVDTMEQYEIPLPPGIHITNRRDVRLNTILVALRDGSLGFLSIVWRKLYLWVSNFSDGVHLQWIRWKAVMLDQMFSLPLELISLPMSIEESPRFQIIGYDEDENVVYVWTIVGIVFALQVDTMKCSKVLDNYRCMHWIYPYKSFFHPAGVNGDGDIADVIGH